MKDTVREQFTDYRAAESRTRRNELIEQHRWLALRCARRFAGKRVPIDDLTQVAQIGLLKAVERYDPEYGTQFSTFAVPTIVGELRRHFRDSTWTFHVPRRLKDLHVDLGAAIEQLTHKLARAPRPGEVARHLHVTEEEVLEALDAQGRERTQPLDREDSEGDVDPDAFVGAPHPELEATASRHDIRAAIAQLPPRERKIVYLRFYEGLTQSEIGARMRCSQVHVSRLLRSSLDSLKDELAG